MLWDYRVVSSVSLGNENDVTNFLNEYGGQGWELCAVSTFGPSRWYYFKRQIKT